MQSVLEAGMKSGEFRDMDANYAMRLILAPLVFLLLWRHSFDFCDSKNIDAERYLDQHLDMVINGLVPSVNKIEHAGPGRVTGKTKKKGRTG